MPPFSLSPRPPVPYISLLRPLPGMRGANVRSYPECRWFGNPMFRNAGSRHTIVCRSSYEECHPNVPISAHTVLPDLSPGISRFELSLSEDMATTVLKQGRARGHLGCLGRLRGSQFGIVGACSVSCGPGVRTTAPRPCPQRTRARPNTRLLVSAVRLGS